MPEGSATNTYVLDEPFATALRSLRSAFDRAHLAIFGEVDLAVRIHRTLRVDVSPCVVLLVWFPRWSIEQFPRDAASASLVPLHIVVSACGARTEVHFLRSLPRLEEPGATKLSRLQATVLEAVEKIGMRSLST